MILMLEDEEIMLMNINKKKKMLFIKLIIIKHIEIQKILIVINKIDSLVINIKEKPMVYKIIYKSEREGMGMTNIINSFAKAIKQRKGCAECIRGDDYEDLNKYDREHESIRFWI